MVGGLYGVVLMQTPPSVHPPGRNGAVRYLSHTPAHVRRPWLHRDFGPRSRRRPQRLNWRARLAMACLAAVLACASLLALVALVIGLFVLARGLGELVRHLANGGSM